MESFQWKPDRAGISHSWRLTLQGTDDAVKSSYCLVLDLQLEQTSMYHAAHSKCEVSSYLTMQEVQHFKEHDQTWVVRTHSYLLGPARLTWQRHRLISVRGTESKWFLSN